MRGRLFAEARGNARAAVGFLRTTFKANASVCSGGSSLRVPGLTAIGAPKPARFQSTSSSEVCVGAMDENSLWFENSLVDVCYLEGEKTKDSSYPNGSKWPVFRFISKCKTRTRVRKNWNSRDENWETQRTVLAQPVEYQLRGTLTWQGPFEHTIDADLSQVALENGRSTQEFLGKVHHHYRLQPEPAACAIE